MNVKIYQRKTAIIYENLSLEFIAGKSCLEFGSY
jgi:hypothetical protein